jgi:hypothetical protein
MWRSSRSPRRWLPAPARSPTVIVLSRQHPLVGVVAGTLAALLALGASLLVTERLARVLSPALLPFVTRVFGLVLGGSRGAARNRGPEPTHRGRLRHPFRQRRPRAAGSPPTGVTRRGVSRAHRRAEPAG